jgi:hypothetical protein
MNGTGRWRPEQLRLADDLYLIAHDDRSGRSRLPARVLALGLAGALLAELAVGEHVVVEDGVLVLGAAESAPSDVLAHEALDQVRSETLTVHDWIVFFGRDATARVAARLGRSGALTQRASALPLRPVRWVPTDPNGALMPQVNLVTRLVRGQPVLWEVHDRPDRVAVLERAVAGLSPGLRELIAQVERAVAGAYVTHRT